MDIQPASIAQVRKARDGRMIQIDDDVFDIARRLKELDQNLNLRWSESGEYFVVYETLPDGSEELVTTTTQLTPALVDHLRMLGSTAYDYQKEIDRVDAARDKQIDHEFTEKIGDAGQKLAHALRKDLGVKSRIVVPNG